MNFFGEAWTSTIDILRKDGYRVIAIDQIGYGRSSKPILHYSISTHAMNTKRLLDHLGIKRTDIVTHSMGGMVASRFASLVSGRRRQPRDDQPDRPDRHASGPAGARHH